MDCNSTQLTSYQWLDPQGMIADNSTDLEIDNIQRDAAGVYTCVATSTIDGETMIQNSTANVIIKCECVYVCMYVCDSVTSCQTLSLFSSPSKSSPHLSPCFLPFHPSPSLPLSLQLLLL